MNVNIEELKRLAEAVINCTDAGAAVQASMDFMEEIDPAVTLSLIAEIERVTKQRDELLKALRDVIGWVPGRDKWHTDEPIKAVERARSVLAKVEG